MTPAAVPRAGVRDVDPYVSPQLDVVARLNTNECPYPLPAAFADELADVVRDLPLNRYPDGQMTRLREELAAHHDHPFDGTWTANGSNEVLTELLLAYGGPGQTAVVFEPTYLLHSRLSWLTHTAVTRMRLAPPFRLDEAAVDAGPRRRARRGVRVLAQQPDRQRAAPRDRGLPRRAHRRRSSWSTRPTSSSAATPRWRSWQSTPNVAVVRTFSKAFAMAGARLGYVLTSPDVVADLQRVRLPYHMSALAQAAGIVGAASHDRGPGAARRHPRATRPHRRASSGRSRA